MGKREVVRRGCTATGSVACAVWDTLRGRAALGRRVVGWVRVVLLLKTVSALSAAPCVVLSRRVCCPR